MKYSLSVSSAASIPENLKKGDVITFGRYPHTAEGFSQRLFWQVLDTWGNEVLLITVMGIDTLKYHHEYQEITWEECDLRKWLNDDFVYRAFSDREYDMIKDTHVKNEDNPESHIPGGNDTVDRVFLLSIAEARRYFKDNAARIMKPTDYAVARGIQCDSKTGGSPWWLRSPGENVDYAAHMYTDGEIAIEGSYVPVRGCGVRPAIWITVPRRKTAPSENRKESSDDFAISL